VTPLVSSLPTGTVTFFFSDLEGSTRLLQHLGDQYAEVLTEQRRLLRDAVSHADGQEIDTTGDGMFFVFSRAGDAVSAAVAAQRAVGRHAWPDGAAVRVRMGLHTGEPLRAETGYVGLDVHRAARICAAGHGGQVLVSEATAILVTEDLPNDVSLRDLGEHRLKDLAHPERVFQVVAPELQATFPALTSLTTLPNNLPIQLTSFVGREREMAEVKVLLGTSRLLTLAGAGGCGKTRLVMQVAGEVVPEFRDGVWLVELERLTDPNLVPLTVAAVVHAPEPSGQGILAALTDYLSSRELLLILDNCEHLIAACAQLVHALLRSCPRIRIIATSRERLGVAGETVWRVPSLGLPDPRHLPPAASLADYESVRLFVDRAVAVLPAFALTAQNARAVAEICHHLDGIPLAVELAAARVNALAPDQIAGRLGERFRLLTGGSRVSLPRHQTLKAAMDWSHDLLAEDERAVLRRLSVFAGGWSLEAAEAICAGDGLEESDVLDVLTHLVDKSLVVADQRDGSVRYRLLDTIRQYGRVRLAEAGEGAATAKRHRDLFAAIAEQAEPRTFGAEAGVWFARLDLEYDNLRAAFETATAEGDAEVAVRLAGSLWWYWYVRAYATEGRGWLEAVLKVTPAMPTATRARLIGRLAFLVWREGDLPGAGRIAEEGLILSRDAGDKQSMALLLVTLAMAQVGDPDRAAALREQGLVLYRELDDPRGITFCLWMRGWTASVHGDYPAAEHAFTERLTYARRVGDRRGIANSLLWLALLAWHEGDYVRATAQADEALSLAREIGERVMVVWALAVGASAALEGGDIERGIAITEEGLVLASQLGDKITTAGLWLAAARVARLRGDTGRAEDLFLQTLVVYQSFPTWGPAGAAQALEGLAVAAAAQGDPARAVRLFGSADAARGVIHTRLPAVDQQDHDHALSATRATLGDDAFAAAWEEGRAMALDRAIRFALGVTA